MTTATEAVDRFAARSARARHAASAYREQRRSELAAMAAFVGKPRPKPRPRPVRPFRPARGPGRWALIPARPGVAAWFAWVPARAAVTASAACLTHQTMPERTSMTVSAAYRVRPGWDGPGMTFDLSRTVNFDLKRTL